MAPPQISSFNIIPPQNSSRSRGSRPVSTIANGDRIEVLRADGDRRFPGPGLPEARLLRSDLSGWIPRLWRGPEGCGTPPAPALPDAGSLFGRALETAEGIRRGLAVGLGLESDTSAVPAVSTIPLEELAPPTAEEVIEQFYLVEKAPEADREALWAEAIAQLRAEDFPCPEEDTSSYADFRARLEALGSRLPSRVVSLRTALTMLNHRETLGAGSDDRPIALVLMGSSDHNGAFSAGGGYPLLDRLENSGRFHVLYYEVQADDAPEHILEEVTRLTGHRIHTLVLAGHGNPTMMSFSGSDPGSSAAVFDETAYLDTTDFLGGEIGSWEDYLDPEGQVLLLSCSNGAGGEASPMNLANCVARAAPGRRVFSTERPGNIDDLWIGNDLELSIEWDNKSPYVAYSEDGALPSIGSGRVHQNANG